jgi:CTP synthase (UTP-ammonia lyase)
MRAIAVLQFQFRVGPGNFCCVHVSLVPVLGVVGEQKTKPTQHSVAVLRSLGLNPHLLACRSQDPLSPAVRDKLVSWMSTPQASGAIVERYCNARDELSPARSSCMLHRADVMHLAP